MLIAMSRRLRPPIHQLFLGIALLASALACRPPRPAVPELKAPNPVPRGESRLQRATASELAAHAPENAMRPLSLGVEAMLARLALTRLAEQSLDLQYYIWKNDLSGRHLTHELLQAADRGVHVRVLLDDLGTGAKDANLLALDAHPNVEIRLFNPSQTRGVRELAMLWDFSKTNRRMHNKIFAADGQAAILGGRNIGDHYFGASDEVLFRDLDVVTFGPVVKEAEGAFTQFWNAPVVFPIEAVAGRKAGPEELAKLRADLNGFIQSQQASPYVTQVQRVSREILEGGSQAKGYHWGSASVLYDDPGKVTRPPENSEGHLITQFKGLKDQIHHELLVVSPYFIPGKEGVAWFKELVQRGIKVTILTNSLAANDVYGVHAGYKRYREALVEAGVRLYELRPDETREEQGKRTLLGSSRASLHAKSFIIDRKGVFIGSMNLDPRSIRLNTEVGLYCVSPSLAEQVGGSLERVLDQIAWRVVREPNASGKAHLVWIESRPEGERRYTEEPLVSTSRKVAVWLIGLLPIESQL